MIVAIINQTVPVGIVPVIQFRQAASTGQAVLDYVNVFNPPLNPADYLGVDTGWVSVQNPGVGMRWSWNFGTVSLVTEQVPETPRGISMTRIVGDAKSDPSAGTPATYYDMGLLSADLDPFFAEDPINAVVRVWGQYRAVKAGANDPKMRFTYGATPLSDELILVDTAGVWTNFSLNSSGYTIPSGRKLFSLQTRLGSASNTIEVRAASVVLLYRT